MNYALILNSLIVVVVLASLFLTSNPACMLGLLMLKEMPYGLIAPGGPEGPDSEYNGGSAGFGFMAPDPEKEELERDEEDR